MCPDKAWKAEEREVAARLGGERVPVTGRGRGHAPDIQHNWLSIEVKSGRNALSAKTILLALEQARASAKKNGGLPIAVCVQSSGRGKPKRYVVCMTLDDFCEHHGLPGG